MAFDPKKIQKGVIKKPRKLLLYGAPKMGKSTLAVSAKNSILLYTEDRVDHIDNQKVKINDYNELIEVFEWLVTNKGNGGHGFKRVIIDSLDWLEPIIHKYVCEKIGSKDLYDNKDDKVNFGKGLKVEAVKGWRNFLKNCDILRDNGFDVILIAHDQITTISPADENSYDKIVMKLDKNALSVLEEWSDIIGYYAKDISVISEKEGLKKKGKAFSKKSRTLYLSGDKPSIMSGNSYGFSDISVTLDQCSEIMEYILTENNN